MNYIPGSSFGSRFGRSSFSSADDGEEELGNILSLHQALKDDDKERDQAVKDLDMSLEYIEMCIRALEVNPIIANQYITMPNFKSILHFITKTPYALSNDVKIKFENLIHEFFDRPILVENVIDCYEDFLISIFERVDEDAKMRGNILTNMRNAGKKLSSIVPQVASDLKNYARARYGQNFDTVGDNKEDEDEDKFDYDEEEDEDEEDE